MRSTRSKLSLLWTVGIAVILAAACGGANDDVAAPQDGPPAISFANEDSSGPDAVATTAPVVVPTTDPERDVAAAIADTDVVAVVPRQDPHEVTVLHANDDAGEIPVFDSPNGNNFTLYDVNAIDGTRYVYPLRAETHFGNKLALLVEEFDASGAWAKVQLPVRPNGTTAWVQTAFFTPETHNYHITISVSQKKVNVYRGDELIVEQIAVTGQESRPTPVVRAYIDEKIPGETLSPAFGDWVLSIAAYSESLGTFGGGTPKLALHGTNQPELMGQAVSSGCVRIPNEVVSFIADTVPVGTIVDIVA